MIIITGIILILFPLAIYILYMIRKSQKQSMALLQVLTIDKMIRYIEAEMVEIVTQHTEASLVDGDVVFSRRDQTIRKLDQALTKAAYGDVPSIRLVKAQITTMLADRYSEDELAKCTEFNFRNPGAVVKPYIKFEILCNRLYNLTKYDKTAKQIPDRNVISYLNDNYNLMEDFPCYFGTAKGYKKEWDQYKLAYMYEKEVLQKFPMTYLEALDVFTNLVFNIYKGHRKIQTLLDLKIDGLEIGTSGSVRTKFIPRELYAGNNAWLEEEDKRNEAKFSRENKVMNYSKTNSVWFQIKASWIHASFLDLETDDEVKITIQQFSQQGKAMPLTDKQSIGVVDMADNSRVTLIRPPTGECWAVFIRKFSDSLNDINFLLKGAGVKNWELVRDVIMWITRGELNVSYTGGQNTGKTTLMKDALCFFKSQNLRMLEMSFEMDLRQLYPERNSFTMKPAGDITAANLQDLAKKMDSYCTGIGEVATDDVVPRLEQAANVGSACVIYSHHGNNDDGLINGLAGSLIAAGAAQSKADAVQRILSFMCINVHLKLYGTRKGTKRVIEYISEIVQEPINLPYIIEKDTNDVSGNLYNMMKLMGEFYQRSTDRLSYHSRFLVKFNEQEFSYEPCDGLTYATLERILTRLLPEERPEFIAWYKKNWLERC